MCRVRQPENISNKIRAIKDFAFATRRDPRLSIRPFVRRFARVFPFGVDIDGRGGGSKKHTREKKKEGG